MQTLVANGHSWLSIKSYTLSEIGAFFKTVMIIERSKKAQTISDIWQGTNLNAEDLQKVLKELGVKDRPKSKPEEIPVEKVNAEWSRLAVFMAKQQGGGAP